MKYDFFNCKYMKYMRVHILQHPENLNSLIYRS